MKIDTNINRFMVSSQFSSVTLPTMAGSPPQLYAQLLTPNVLKAVDYGQAQILLTRNLLQAAEQAYTLRRFEDLEQISGLLACLPGAMNHALYYRALCLWRSGNRAEAQATVERLTAVGPAELQAKALLTLGGYNSKKGNYSDALILYAESLKAGAGDPQTALRAYANISEIRSLEGDHAASLAHLERIEPLVLSVARVNPFFLYSHHNDLACELAALGRTDEARAHSRVACSSPVAAKYDEWQDTARELQEPERVLVVVPEVKAESKAERRVKKSSRLEFLIDLDFPNVRKVQPASNSLSTQTIHLAIIDQVKTRAPDRAPPASLL
jgi:tetratricopeptide (TPR) repeat protein